MKKLLKTNNKISVTKISSTALFQSGSSRRYINSRYRNRNSVSNALMNPLQHLFASNITPSLSSPIFFPLEFANKYLISYIYIYHIFDIDIVVTRLYNIF